MKYIEYNREERNICSHLFSLLHEPKNDYKILREFVGEYSGFKDFNMFSEVALIRDAYHYKKKNDERPIKFLDDIVKIIMKQENVKECSLYSELDNRLRNINETHPRQIRQKASALKISLSEGELKVYGSLQGMFNAKPDLAIVLDNIILVYEAKLTLGFDKKQIQRTKNIAEIWANLLYSDLAFSKVPEYELFKLGLEKWGADISWETIVGILSKNLDANNKSLKSIKFTIK